MVEVLIFVKKQLEINDVKIVNWNNYMRQVCIDSLLRRQKRKIGKPGMILKVDESMFTKRTDNAGRILSQKLIFGGVCRKAY